MLNPAPFFLQRSSIGVAMGVLSLVLVFGGYKMYTLPLWSWWPLAVMLSFWGLVGLWRVFAIRTDTFRVTNWGLAHLSGLLFALGFPISPLVAFMFVGFVPLLLVGARMRRAGVPAKRYYWLCWYAFVLWNILSTFWVANAAFAPAVIAVAVNSLLMALPMLVFYKAWGRTKNWLALLLWTCAWLSMELLHNRWELSWPWLTLGNAFAQKPEWVQWYELTGVPGGSLWILCVNALIFLPRVNTLKINLYRPMREKLPLLILIFLPVIGSYIRYFTYVTQGDKQEVVAIQPNFEPHYEKFDMPETFQMDRVLQLADTSVSANTDWLVLPESVIHSGMREPFLQPSDDVVRLKKLPLRYPKLQIVLGTDSYRVFENEAPPASARAVRTRERDGQKTQWEAYNSAIMISAAPEIPVYHKSKLVPGAEILPMKWLFAFLNPLFNTFGGTVEGLGTQPERSVFGRQHKVAPIICYESIYGDFVGDYVQQGAQALFVMSNDGWWDDTPGYQQHRNFSALRAIETRLDVVRATNTGSSCFINQRGNIRQATTYNKAIAIKDTMLFRKGAPTFYVRFGDWLAWLALICGVLGFFCARFKWV